MIRQVVSTLTAALLVTGIGFAQPPAGKPATDRTVQQPLPRTIQGEKPLINDVKTPAVQVHPVTPYLESSTILLVDFNLAQVDVEQAVRWLGENLGGPTHERDVATARGFVDSLKGAGVAHLYVTVSTRSPVDGWPLVIVPCNNTAVVEGLASVLVQSVPEKAKVKIHSSEGVVLIGPPQAIDRVSKPNVAGRADLTSLPKADQPREHVAVLSIPEQARRDLIALWPDRLPEELPLQVSPRELVSDISRVIVSLNLPPTPTVTIEIETSDEAAVKRVKKDVDKMLELSAEVRDSVNSKLAGNTLALTASADAVAKLAAMILGPTRARAERQNEMNRMKQLGLAIHTYYDKENHLPPRYLADANGKPLLSWRVAILPYVDQRAMYDKVHLDKAWDSEQNAWATLTVIPAFSDGAATGAKTTVRAPVYPGSLWDGDGPPKSLRDVTDGTSNTIALIDAPATAAVAWTDPQPWVLSNDDPMSSVFGDRDEATVLLLDGAALVLRKAEMTNDKLKAMLTIAGREVIE